MQAAGVYLPRNMQANVFEMSSHALSLRFSSSYGNTFGDLFRGRGAGVGEVHSSGVAVHVQTSPILPAGGGTPSWGDAAPDAGRGEEHQV